MILIRAFKHLVFLLFTRTSPFVVAFVENNSKEITWKTISMKWFCYICLKNCISKKFLPSWHLIYWINLFCFFFLIDFICYNVLVTSHFWIWWFSLFCLLRAFVFQLKFEFCLHGVEFSPAFTWRNVCERVNNKEKMEIWRINNWKVYYIETWEVCRPKTINLFVLFWIQE